LQLPSKPSAPPNTACSRLAALHVTSRTHRDIQQPFAAPNPNIFSLKTMINPQQGNRTILLLLAIGMAVAAFFVQWGVVTITADDLRDSLTINGQKPGDGLGELFGGMISSLSGMKVSCHGHQRQLDSWAAQDSLFAPDTFGDCRTPAYSYQLTSGIRHPPNSHSRLACSRGCWRRMGSDCISQQGSMGIGSLLLIAASIIGFKQQQSLHPSNDLSPQPTNNE
jgi:hypothetical protein